MKSLKIAGEVIWRCCSTRQQWRSGIRCTPSNSRRCLMASSGALWLCGLLLCSNINLGGAAELADARLDHIPQRMQQYVERGELAGAVTVVGTRDGQVRIDAVGSLDLDSKQPLPKNALFRIASMTKPITAMAIMILQDEQKLDVTDPVEKHLPEFRGQMLVANRDAETVTLKNPPRPITIRDLLTHTSGLPGGLPAGLSDIYVRRQLTLKEAVLVSSQIPLDFEPGSKWSYCNAGIDTLGRIVEVVSGESFESFLSNRIFQPLGMQDTTFYPQPGQLSRVPPVYDSVDGKLVVSKNLIIGLPPNPKHPIPAGGLYSTAEDLARFYRMTLNGGRLENQQIISAAGLETMTRLQTGELTCGFVPGMGFGYGFAVVREPQGVTSMLSPGSFGHGGAFGTQGWVDPERGIFTVLLIQRTGLRNADGSDMRRDLQALAVAALSE